MEYRNLAINFIKRGNKKLEYYDGALIGADKNLHQQVFKVVTEICKSKNIKKEDIKILDIACGNGAFSKKMYDNGYIVECCDVTDAGFKFKDKFKFTKIDINSDEFINFCETNEENYDIIISMETIEHLENPWRFMKGLKKLCKKERYIILTTPNIESPWSKSSFVVSNKFFQFSEGNLSYWHINPLTEFEILLIGKNLRLTCEEVMGGGEYPIIWLPENIIEFDLHKITWTLLHLFAFPFCKKVNLSWCKIYVLKKQNDNL